MLKCTDETQGAMLHGFELGLLTEDETERFEAHLLVCDACFQKAQEFEPYVKRLRSESVGGKVVKRYAQENSAHQRTGLWRLLWPKESMILKPAVALVIILALLYPAYLGLSGSHRPEVRRLQAIQLVPDRSGNERGVVDRDVVLSFVFEGAKPGREYDVQLQDETGRVLYHDQRFTGFDTFGTGFLLLPRVMLRTSDYRLIIVDPRGHSPSDTAVYRFELTEPAASK